MRLQVTCRNCKKKIPFHAKVNSRDALLALYGEVFALECMECVVSSDYTPNDVVAIIDKKKLFVIVGLTLLGAIIFIAIFGKYILNTANEWIVFAVLCLITLPFSVLFGVLNTQDANRRIFNSQPTSES